MLGCVFIFFAAYNHIAEFYLLLLVSLVRIQLITACFSLHFLRVPWAVHSRHYSHKAYFVTTENCAADDVSSNGVAVPHSDLTHEDIGYVFCPEGYTGLLTIHCQDGEVTVEDGLCIGQYYNHLVHVQ